tara:strand:- start:3620 stop:3829 length:210 start_codon:yes stop_codon:yes gene_type:complete
MKKISGAGNTLINIIPQTDSKRGKFSFLHFQISNQWLYISGSVIDGMTTDPIQSVEMNHLSFSELDLPL